MLKSRVLTALVLLPLVLWMVFADVSWLFGTGVGLVVLIAAWEWSGLIELKHRWSRWNFLALIAVSISFFYAGTPGVWLTPILGVGIAWWLVALFLLARAAGGKRLRLVGWRGVLVGWLVLVPAWCALYWLHLLPGGAWFVMLLFLLVWSADIGAYFTGRRFGRRKLAPAISPGKTLEGVAGGATLALLLLLCVPLVSGWPPLPLTGLFSLAVTVILVSVAGDLFESLLKRGQGVKDSGSLLPGHGGMLDRVDSLTAAAPVFCAGVYAMLSG